MTTENEGTKDLYTLDEVQEELEKIPGMKEKARCCIVFAGRDHSVNR